MKILLVEDDDLIAKGLVYLLEQNNFEVMYISKGRNIDKYLDNVDLIILDVSLPDCNGFDLYNKTIKKYDISTIFLTARDDEDDIVKGLELGAEDYITKPFLNKELLARINRIIARKKKNNIKSVKDIKFDLDKMLVYKNDEIIKLTSLELKILHLLFININKVVTRDMIIEKIWEWTGNDVNDNTVTVYLKRIREKLNSDIIVTIKGIGYRIDEEK